MGLITGLMNQHLTDDVTVGYVMARSLFALLKQVSA
jgi:hypothetical protein